MKTFAPPGSRIAVAIDFDGHSDYLCSFAQWLAKRTGSTIQLVHAMEPLAVSSLAALVTHQDLGTLSDAVETERCEKAEAQLHELVEKSGLPEETRTSVVYGRIADAINEEVSRTDCALLIVAASQGPHRFVPTKFSVPMSLMDESRVPVMVVPEDVVFDTNKTATHIVVADDLTDASQPAIWFGASLGNKLGSCQISHVHINPVEKEVLETTVAAALAAGHVHLQQDLTSAQIFSGIKKSLNEKLAARAPYDLRNIDHYMPKLFFGPIVETLDEVVESTNADFVVYGRHRTIHRRPFHFGNIPYKEVLGKQRIAVIAPPLP